MTKFLTCFQWALFNGILPIFMYLFQVLHPCLCINGSIFNQSDKSYVVPKKVWTHFNPPHPYVNRNCNCYGTAKILLPCRLEKGG